MKRTHAGVTLIEVLIAIVLMAVGLIGIAALQTAAISSNVLANQYTQAATLAQNIIERMRANREGVLSGAYLRPAGAIAAPGIDCSTTVCTATQQAAWDLAVWYASTAQAVTLAGVPPGPSANLPSAQVSIACTAPCSIDAVRMVTIYWDGDATGATGLGCDANNSSDLRCFRVPFVP